MQKIAAALPDLSSATGERSPNESGRGASSYLHEAHRCSANTDYAPPYNDRVRVRAWMIPDVRRRLAIGDDRGRYRTCCQSLLGSTNYIGSRNSTIGIGRTRSAEGAGWASARTRLVSGAPRHKPAIRICRRPTCLGGNIARRWPLRRS